MATTKFYGTGRRKKSIARVRLFAGSGKYVVNGRDMAEYLQTDILLKVAKQLKYCVIAKIKYVYMQMTSYFLKPLMYSLIQNPQL